MIFSDKDFSVKIISVLVLDWNDTDALVQPRPYDALSFRLIGNSVISDSTHTEIMQDNSLLFMPAGKSYKVKSGYEKVIVVHFNSDSLNNLDFEVFNPDNAHTLQSIFENMYTVWHEKQPGYYYKTVSLFYKLLGKLSRNYSSELSSPSYIKIKPALEIIRSDFTNPSLDILTLCNACNMSDTYFRKMFYSVYKTSPVKYINKLRIDYAAELLTSGYYTVEAVADLSGFNSQKYFSSLFKQMTGCSPTAYKNNYL